MRTRSLLVVTMVAALALSLWVPAAANGNDRPGRGHGAGPARAPQGETVIGRDWDASGECASIVARSRAGKGLVAALDWTNDCPGRWLSAPVTACLPDGTRTEYVWLFVEDDLTMDRGMLSRLGLRPATHMATFPGSVSGWGEELPPAENFHGGYYVVDADGRIHDHTTEPTYPPLEAEQVVSGDVDGNHFLARTNRRGAITELEFVNRSDVVGHYIFELRYRNGRFSQVFTVQVAPDTVATMDRRIMARLGIRNAVGVGDRLVEFGEFTPGATHFDEDGNVTKLQDRRDPSMCPANIT